MSQSELNFDAPSPSGYESWLAQRQRAAIELGRKLNLPIGHPVELWLAGGVRLRGVLQLNEGFLFVDEPRLDQIELRIDNVVFRRAEIESFLRQD